MLEPEWFDEWFDSKFTKEIFTPREIAEMVGVDTQTVYRALRSAELEGFRIGQRIWVIPRPAVRQWLIERNAYNVD